MPIEKLYIDQAGGMAFSDEERASLVAADYAESVSFVEASAMLAPQPHDELVLGSVANLNAVAVVSENKLLAHVSSIVSGTTTYSNALVEYTLSTGAFRLVSGTSRPNVAPVPVFAFRSWRFLRTDYSRSFLWQNAATSGTTQEIVADAPLERPANPQTFLQIQSAETLRSSFSGRVTAIIYESASPGYYTQQLVVSLDSLTQREISMLQGLVSSRVRLEWQELPGTTPVQTEYVLASISVSGSSATLVLESVSSVALSGTPIGQTVTLSVTVHISAQSLQTRFDVSAGRAFYAVAYVYDGYQEGPLSSPVSVDLKQNQTHVRLPVNSNIANAPSPRVRAVAVYRAMAFSAGAPAPETSYRYVGTVNLISGGGLVFLEDDLSLDRNTYEERTGIPETVDTQDLRYRVAATDGIYYFVGDVHLYRNGALAEDWSVYVFRSQPLRPDMFDWTKDFVRLPEPPTAMAFLAGKLLVWTTSSLYILSRDLAVLERLQGLGCKSQVSVVVWDYGVSWASSDGWWVYDGANVLALGVRLRHFVRATEPPGVNAVKTAAGAELPAAPYLSYDPARRALILWGNPATRSGLWAWVYYLQERQLALRQYTDSDAVTLAWSGWYGEPFILRVSGSTRRVYRVMRSSPGMPWVWRSVDLARGERVRIYELVMIRIGGGTSPLPQVYVVHENTSGQLVRTPLSVSGSGEKLRYRPVSPLEARTMHIEINGPGPVFVRSLMVRLRRLGR